MAKKKINGRVPINETAQVTGDAQGNGQFGRARPSSAAAAAPSPQGEGLGNGTENVQVEQAAVGVSGPIGVEQVREAARVLQEYKQGKAALNERTINNEQWYRLHNQGAEEMSLNNAPDSAWLFNSLANKHADAMDNYPEPNVLPRAEDDTDTAKQLSAILPVVLEQNRYEQVYNDAWWYKIKHGTGCKMVVWDGSKAGGLGDIDIRMVDLLNLYWEPGVTDLQASRNLFHLEMLDDELLIQRWPWAKGHTGGAEQTPKYLYDDQVRTDGKSLVVDWYYKRAGKLHYCKFVNDCVLYASENDPDYAERGYYDHGKYPFVMDVMFPMAGSPAGFGYIELMKGAQYSIDVLGAAITRNADAASRVRYFVNRSSGLNEEEFSDLDKSLVHVEGSLGEDSVRSIQVPTLSDIYVTHLNNKISELKETSGNRDFSQGVTGSGVTAASAIAALQEAGSKLSRDALKSAYRAFTEECYLCIELMRQFYTTARAFRITGEDGTGYEFTEFDNSGLQPQRDAMDFGQGMWDRLPVFDINVVAAKKSTYSRLSQNELAKELYQLGFFRPDLADQAAACLQMMDFDGKDRILEQVRQNGTLYQQVQQLQATMMKMAAVLDAQNGTGITANMGQAIQMGENVQQPGKVGDKYKTTTDSIGNVVAGNSLATQAQRRAQNNANPGRETEK